MVCFHSVGFGRHTQDHQCVPCIFVDILRKGSQGRARLHTKEDISHFFLLLVSQDSVSFDAPFHLIMAFRGLSFSFVVYLLDLLVMVCSVFIVLTLEFPGLVR